MHYYMFDDQAFDVRLLCSTALIRDIVISISEKKQELGDHLYKQLSQMHLRYVLRITGATRVS